MRMGKAGRKGVVETKGLGDQVTALYLNGISYREIAASLGLEYNQVQTYLAKVKRPARLKANKVMELPIEKGVIANHIRLEINQENALSELAKQLDDYSKEYDRALDSKEKYAWSQNRIRILQEMNKVTGLYEPRPCNTAPAPAVEVNDETYTTEELREIIEFEAKHPLRADKEK
jgi:transposase